VTRTRVEFLYEDEHIVAVDKPAGLAVIAPDGSRSRSLYDIVTERIQRRNPRGRAAVVHRLDRDTSGVMLFAKDARTKERLMGSWNELVKLRRYVALAEGAPPAREGVLDTWLLDTGEGRVRQVAPGTRGALRSVTAYRVVGEGGGYSLLELDLETGRRHQIRVQLAAVGCPVAGDERYGSRRDPLGRLGLHASLIELDDPFGGGTLRFESPVPASFREALSASRARVGRDHAGRAPAMRHERQDPGADRGHTGGHRTGRGRPGWTSRSDPR